jgi:hypothetical protein
MLPQTNPQAQNQPDWKVLKFGSLMGWGFRSMVAFFWVVWLAIAIGDPPENWTGLIWFALFLIAIVAMDLTSWKGVRYSVGEKKLDFVESLLGTELSTHHQVHDILHIYLLPKKMQYGNRGGRYGLTNRVEQHLQVVVSTTSDAFFGLIHDDYKKTSRLCREIARDFGVPYLGIHTVSGYVEGDLDSSNPGVKV